ncbi:hypothetical protein CEXT_698231 [Caerostris extrusa]|uniref:Uncharacterized protein n=1 Tax=Caerostris extrusa TaxID=172846 RepID=A0AAV4RXV9_CAEEX|nr:hypothetical protein CEXT_698231 [Caerostris extrusa]
MLDKLSHSSISRFQRNLLHLTQPRKEENGGQREKETQKASGRGRRNYGVGMVAGLSLPIRNLLYLTQTRKEEENGGQRERKKNAEGKWSGEEEMKGRNGSGSLVTDSVHLVRTESAVTPPLRDQ